MTIRQSSHCSLTGIVITIYMQLYQRHSHDSRETFVRVSYDSDETFAGTSHHSHEIFVWVSHDGLANVAQFHFSQLSCEMVLFMLQSIRICITYSSHCVDRWNPNCDVSTNVSWWVATGLRHMRWLGDWFARIFVAQRHYMFKTFANSSKRVGLDSEKRIFNEKMRKDAKRV